MTVWNLLRRVLAGAIAVLVVLVTVGGCSNDDSDVPTADVHSPEAASQLLFNAWSRGDESAARSVADDLVVDTLFQMPFSDELAFEGCPGEADTWFCSFTGGGEGVTFFVRPTDDGPHITSMTAE